MWLVDDELHKVPPRWLSPRLERVDRVGWGVPVVEGGNWAGRTALGELPDAYVFGDGPSRIEEHLQTMYRGGLLAGHPLERDHPDDRKHRRQHKRDRDPDDCPDDHEDGPRRHPPAHLARPTRGRTRNRASLTRPAADTRRKPRIRRFEVTELRIMSQLPRPPSRLVSPRRPTNASHPGVPA